MFPSDLGVFGLDKRAAAADEASGGNTAADNLWQQDGWAKAVAHTACAYCYCCTGHHKVVKKGARGRHSVVIWLTRDATSP